MLSFQYSRIAAICAALLALWMCPARAQQASADQEATTANESSQEQPAAKKPKKPYGGGTPIDVIVNNKLWETAPEAKDWVKENRRPVDELKYESTVGNDPERPKTRSTDELNALRAELNDAATHNSQAATGKKKADNQSVKKSKAAKAPAGAAKSAD
jgi:hypothetical protein